VVQEVKKGLEICVAYGKERLVQLWQNPVLAAGEVEFVGVGVWGIGRSIFESARLDIEKAFPNTQALAVNDVGYLS